MTERFADDVVLQRASSALSRRLLSGVLVLVPGMSESLEISVPGDLIWDLLAEPLTVADLVEALASSYGVSARTVRADIEPVLRALDEAGALSVTSALRE